LTRSAVAAHFRGRGYRVETLDAAEPSADVIVVGTHRRDPSGDHVLRRLHESVPATPIVLVGDRSTQLTIDEALACGVYAILHAPVRLQELELTILRLTGNASGDNTGTGRRPAVTPETAEKEKQ